MSAYIYFCLVSERLCGMMYSGWLQEEHMVDLDNHRVPSSTPNPGSKRQALADTLNTSGSRK